MPQEWCSSNSPDYQRRQVGVLDKALDNLRLRGIGPGIPGFDIIAGFRSELLRKVGFKVPRATLNILRLFGLSPGELGLWLDVEDGWMVEARVKIGAPPVYKSVGDELAATIIKGELTHEGFIALLEPNIDIDN